MCGNFRDPLPFFDFTIRKVKKGMKRNSIWILAALLTLLVMGCDNKPTSVEEESVESIAIEETLRIAPGEKERLNVTVVPWYVGLSSNPTWSSSNEAIATVDHGLVLAVAEGKATVTAKAEGKEATCEVTVCVHSWSDKKCTKCGIGMYLMDGEINDEDILTKYTGIEPNVVIPEGVTGIGSEAFKNYNAAHYLTSVTIPNTVTSIGDKAFYDCTKLKTVNYGGMKEQWNAITKGDSWDFDTGNYTTICKDGRLDKKGNTVED